jgi:histidinol-phosphate aminotransferase
VLVALDEAYREFVTDPDVTDGLELLAAHPNLVVLRTFSKAYRLAGLRVGYAVASPEVAQALRKVGVPFAVSAPAQAAALAALDHEAELLAACRDVTVERGRVVAELRSAGYAVPSTQANFAWLPLGADAQRFAAHCAEHKVIVRPFPGDGVRVTIGSPDENDAFLAAVMSVRG